ncbi:MAG TPA: DUF1292 domain-containing protein [Firmicutes bacterium]|nr:DUF1292 domain-containing protein [Bacillota bacterium]
MDGKNEYTPDLFTLVDEEGNEVEFELLDVMEEGEERYFALIPYHENPEEMLDDDGDLVILKSEIVNDEEMLASIDDDDEYERIGAIFLERLENAFDEEDEIEE